MHPMVVVKPTYTAVNATTSTTEVVAAKKDRRYLLVINDSDTVIYIRPGANAVLNQGIRLNANGGSMEFSSDADNLTTVEIDAIHAGAGNKVLLIMEA